MRPGTVTGVYPAKTFERGTWKIEPFTVDERGFALQFGSISSTGRYCPPGSYTRLVKGSQVIMSDTPDELRDLVPFWYVAREPVTETVLINGLGLGCALQIALAGPGVERIDVVEIDPDVIDLISELVHDDRVTFHCADAFEIDWPKKSRWDAVWHDVWPDLNTDNLSNEKYAKPGTYAALNRKYGKRARWQGAWAQGVLQSLRNRGY